MNRHQASLVKLIKKYAPNPQSGAEIGVYKGFTSRVLCKEFPDCRWLFVDPWTEHSPDSAYYKMDRRAGRHEQSTWDNMAKRAAHRIADAQPKSFTILRMTGSEAADLYVPDGSLDFVFIDANHHERAVRKDIEQWLPKCRKFICGHDYGGMFRGVKKAVNRKFGDKVEVYPGKVWAVKL